VKRTLLSVASDLKLFDLVDLRIDVDFDGRAALQRRVKPESTGFSP
jgi:hypothetical protein